MILVAEPHQLVRKSLLTLSAESSSVIDYVLVVLSAMISFAALGF
jgi:hypothetical protein